MELDPLTFVIFPCDDVLVTVVAPLLDSRLVMVPAVRANDTDMLCDWSMSEVVCVTVGGDTELGGLSVGPCILTTWKKAIVSWPPVFMRDNVCSMAPKNGYST